MSLYVSSLNSGSNGNCYYIGNDDEAILIDAGLSCRTVEKRMRNIGLHMGKVKAVFISHEHGDHISGVAGIAVKHSLPVYLTVATRAACHLLTDEYVRNFTAFENISIGNISVSAFPKYHDAADPHSFVVTCNGTTVGVFTDIGKPCENLIRHFKRCHAAFLETNYDEALLRDGRYPFFLKKRISGGYGHLSNSQALEIFVKYRPSFMTHLFASHISKENNCPDLIQELFSNHAGKTKVVVASRNCETPVYLIRAEENKPESVEVRLTQGCLF